MSRVCHRSRSRYRRRRLRLGVMPKAGAHGNTPGLKDGVAVGGVESGRKLGDGDLDGNVVEPPGRRRNHCGIRNVMASGSEGVFNEVPGVGVVMLRQGQRLGKAQRAEPRGVCLAVLSQRQASKVSLEQGGRVKEAVVEAAEGASHRNGALEGGDVQGAPAVGVNVNGEGRWPGGRGSGA